MELTIIQATAEHATFAERICQLYSASAKERGTGIAERKPEYIREKILKGNAIIALGGDQLAGFCYIESWSHNKYVANSGLIVSPDFRKLGLAKRIKEKILELSRKKYPQARIFGITTSLAVMKINSALGYQPVTFSELTQDDAFWDGCKTCKNYDILLRNERQMCLCTAMLAPSQEDLHYDLSNLILTNNEQK